MKTAEQILAERLMEPSMDAIDNLFIMTNQTGRVLEDTELFPRSCSVVSICVNGHCRLRINDREFDFSTNQMLSTFPYDRIEYVEMGDDYAALRILINQDFGASIASSEDVPAQVLMITRPVFNLTEEEKRQMISYYLMLRYTVSQVENVNRLRVVASLLDAMLHTFMAFKYFRENIENNPSRNVEVFRKFYLLVKEHCKESHNVGFYADKLCITPKYLSTIVQEVSRRNAKEWINNFVIWESKAMLKNKRDLSIIEISLSLGFPDQYTFSKFFKRCTGMTPIEFRESSFSKH